MFLDDEDEFEDANDGLDMLETCPECDGWGNCQECEDDEGCAACGYTGDCPHCDGSGEVEDDYEY